MVTDLDLVLKVIPLEITKLLYNKSVI